MGLKSIEICAGAGGQALGLEEAGFDHLALGTGDIDCMYHFALYELVDAVREYGEANGREDIIEQLETLIAGKRLKDISDLPLDLCL
ncbi:MAG: NgoMIV family type II restriction endonuclease [Sutterella wadsworthensis]